MVLELVDEVWWLDLRGVNAYLVDDDVPTLVDAGTRWDAPAVRSGIREAGFSLDDIGRVLLTHYDLDHAGGLARLSSELSAPVHAGAPDADVLRGI
ncbi:MAG: MBL fold metallo-hydrolase, partial [Halobacteriales archaeon]|nr:MBL fold metallo-hydrolase [Halobacteriales archaeon]